jgi:hypothetical protein
MKLSTAVMVVASGGFLGNFAGSLVAGVVLSAGLVVANTVQLVRANPKRSPTQTRGKARNLCGRKDCNVVGHWG